MKDIKAKIILDIEIENVDLISQLNVFSQELSLSLDEIILYAIEKLIYDIKYVRKLRD